MPWQNNSGGGRGPWGQGPQGPGPGGRGPFGGGKQPDLEEALRLAQEKLRQWLPGGLGGGRGVALVAGAILVLWCFTGFYRVDAGEQGVLLRFGAYAGTTGSGLNWHLPSPIERVVIVNTERSNTVSIGGGSSAAGEREQRAPGDDPSLMLTGDENIIDLDFTVLWKIKPTGAADFLFKVENPEETVRDVAESAMREVIGQSQISRALTEGRRDIEIRTQTLMQAVLDQYGSGILISQVKLQRVDPPGAVIDSFRDVQAAKADLERQRNEAQTYANAIIPQARGEAGKMLQDAEAYKNQVLARATGEASQFNSLYQQYRLAKDVTRERLYLETMQEVLSRMNKVLVDPKAGSGVVPYLPLPAPQPREGAKP